MVVRFAPTEAGDWAYRITSNIAGFDGKTANFAAAASPSPGFIHPENVHHWVYSERDERGLVELVHNRPGRSGRSAYLAFLLSTFT